MLKNSFEISSDILLKMYLSNGKSIKVPKLKFVQHHLSPNIDINLIYIIDGMSNHQNFLELGFI